LVRAPHRSSQCGFAALDYIGRCGGWAEDGVSGPTTYRFGQGTWLRPTYFKSPRHQRRAGSIWPSGTEAANPALCPFHSLQTGFSEKGRLRPRRRPARRVSPARKPVKLFLRRRQLLDSGHYQALAWVVGASAGAAWITATADNGLVGFQKAAQRPGRSSLSPCRRFGGCAPFSGMAGTRLSYGRTIGSRDPRLQVAADRCGLLIVSPCDSIARSDELRLEM